MPAALSRFSTGRSSNSKGARTQMIAALLLAFREGLEAALILGIVLSVLRRVGRRDQERMVWFG
ncbi:MAG: hypothetical protein GWN58_44225, partial [Anaerolineae bacterium]|nr:hypothetical protein [Anaerolineae bacterium]